GAVTRRAFEHLEARFFQRRLGIGIISPDDLRHFHFGAAQRPPDRAEQTRDEGDSDAEKNADPAEKRRERPLCLNHCYLVISNATRDARRIFKRESLAPAQDAPQVARPLSAAAQTTQ